MPYLRFYTMLVFTAGLAYYLGGLKSEPSPVWDCYRYLWGDANAMRVHNLQGFSAQEVHAYCVDMVNNDEPALMVLKDTESAPLGQAFEQKCPPCVCAEVDNDDGCLDDAFIHEEIKP